MIDDLIDFFDAPSSVSFNLAPSEAIAFFKAKGLKATFDYRDLLAEEHAAAFTVAKMMDQDLLADVHGSLDQALADGKSFQQWADELRPTLQAKGWWGREAVVDPLTGQTVVAQLGSAGRLKTIFRTNTQSAYAVGAWEQIQSQANAAPYLLYDAVDDHRTRPEHAEQDNKVYPVDDPFWQVWYPPNGYNCRCGVIQLDEADMAALNLKPSPPTPIQTTNWTNPRTGKTVKVPVGQDPGFAYNVGKARLEQLAKLAAEKLALLPPAQKIAAIDGVEAAKLEAQAALEAQVLDAQKVLAKAEGAANLVKSQMKAAQRAATFQIEKALAEKTPYLSTAIKTLQASGKTFANPGELLEAAKGIAAKQKQSGFVSEWKKAYLADKTPSKSAQSAFDALPDDAKSALTTTLDAQKAATAAQAKALAQLEDIAAGKASQAQADILAKLATDPGFPLLQPADKLAKFQVKLAEFQASKNTASALSNYKKAILAGKTPSVGQKAAFDALTPDAQAKFLAKIDKELGAKAPAPAPTPSQALTGGYKPTLSPTDQAWDVFYDLEQAGFKSHATSLAQVFNGPNWPGLPDVDKLKVVDAWKATYHKLTGTPPTVLTAPQALNATPPPQVLDAKTLTQIGPQKGSNPGGLYQDPATGQKFYIKLFDADDKVRNEMLAAELYKLAGAEVPELTRIPWPDGRIGLASKWVDGLNKGTPGQLLAAEGAAEFFATDAWLANWDVVGLSNDNLALVGKRAFRVDVGGSLRYRAQGGLKGNAWNDSVSEIDTMRTNKTTAGAVFGPMTEDQLIASVRRVLKPSDLEIADLVERFGPIDANERAELLRTLLARRETLRKRFPKAAEGVPMPPTTPGAVKIDRQDIETITASRSNGYTIRTDGGDIEDHNVLVAHHIDADGNPFTRVSLKLTEAATARTVTRLTPLHTGAKPGGRKKAVAANELGHDHSTAKAQVLQWVKGVNSRAAKGEALEVKDLERAGLAKINVESSLANLRSFKGKVTPAAELELSKQIVQLESIAAQLTDFLANAKAGQAYKAIAKIDLDAIPDQATFPKPAGRAKKVVAPAAQEVTWTYRSELPGEQATLVRGYVTHTRGGTGQDMGGAISEGKGPNGERILAMIDPSTQRAMKGTVWIDVPGNTAVSAQRAFDLIDRELGLSATRTTLIERSDQYLNAFARLRLFTASNRTDWLAFNQLDQVADLTERVRQKVAFLNKKLGLDIERTDGWGKRDGVEQAFGHGRISQLRPDADTPEWQKWEREHVIYHNPSGLGWDAGSTVPAKLERFLDSGGGILAQAERLRRGIYGSGASPTSDRASGGAAYVFTRLSSRANSHGKAGFYWKARVARRVDAISYDGDNYGNTDDNHLLNYRRTTPDQLARAAAQTGNETIFKQGLSLFDDLDAIVVEDSQVASTLAMVRKHYKQWPDGRKLEDVIMGETQWRKVRAKRS